MSNLMCCSIRHDQFSSTGQLMNGWRGMLGGIGLLSHINRLVSLCNSSFVSQRNGECNANSILLWGLSEVCDLS